MELRDVRLHYQDRKEEIEDRMDEFRSLRESGDERWFLELAFVVLSSQTDAKEAWSAARKLEEMEKLESGPEGIFDVLKRYEIQFASRKADQISQAHRELSQPSLREPGGGLSIESRLKLEDPQRSRKWLYENVPGLGLKGSSHFLRNIGYGEDLGIASRHTLSMLDELGAPGHERPPSSLEEYRSVEEDMSEIGERLGISTGAVDLVLWSMKTGEVFR